VCLIQDRVGTARAAPLPTLRWLQRRVTSADKRKCDVDRIPRIDSSCGVDRAGDTKRSVPAGRDRSRVKSDLTEAASRRSRCEKDSEPKLSDARLRSRAQRGRILTGLAGRRELVAKQRRTAKKSGARDVGHSIHDESDASAAESSLRNSISKLVASYRATAVERFERLAREVEAEPAIPHQEKVAALYEAIESLFTSVDHLSRSAPDKAPELWRSRADKSEKIFSFIRRVYAPYIGRIRRSDLRRLDFSLYKSLYYKRHKSEYEAESDLELLSAREANDRLLSQLNGEVSLSDIRSSMPAVLRQRLRLYEALSRRRGRKKASDGPA
jgi:hypothetical protein